MKGKKKMWIIVSLIMLILAIGICIIIPPSFGRTKTFLDENGNILEGSISEKIFVDVNDTSLGMFIMAKDEKKPVLLFLGGGPGLPTYLLEQEYPTGLENEFVVCYLEYRGTSLSYNSKITNDNMTLEQFIDDIVGVTDYLRDRFNQDKVYLMAISFGTYIAINTVKQHPDLYHAYIAMSQIVNQKESEFLAYNYMFEQYQAQGNDKMINRFLDYPITEYEEIIMKYVISGLRDTAMHELGVGTARDMKSVITGLFIPSLRCTVYTPMERINIWRGKSFAQVSPIGIVAFLNSNVFEMITEINIPIYFLAGIYDYTTNYALQKEYYEKIKAPHKAFYTFENSAHSPLFEEPEKAMEILVRDVLSY